MVHLPSPVTQDGSLDNIDDFDNFNNKFFNKNKYQKVNVHVLFNK